MDQSLVARPTGNARDTRRPRRRAGITGLAALLTLGTVPALTLSTGASAAVTFGTGVIHYPDRDMVLVGGYNPGEQLTVDVLRDDVVIGTTSGPAVDLGADGFGLEVNHGVEGTPGPGDCWVGVTPDIMPGDVIRVTASTRGVDTSTVQDVTFVGEPELTPEGDGVTIRGTATIPLTAFAVEFRSGVPDFRVEGVRVTADAAGNGWTATFRPTTTAMSDDDEVLTPQQQVQAALGASWLAAAVSGNETTLAEHDGLDGVAAGCTGTSEPNNVASGYLAPVNIASGDITLSGTARSDVETVTVTVGALPPATAALTANADPTKPKTWSLPVTRADLGTLPDGTITIASTYTSPSGTVSGTNRTMVKDTVAPLAPTATPPAGVYGSAQQVTLNKPAGESTSSTHYEIGTGTVPDPGATSPVYSTQIGVTASQVIKAVVVDAAGNTGAVATFDYKIGTPPNPPTITAAEVRDGVRIDWTPPTTGTTVTGFNVYRVGGTSPLNPAPLASDARSYTDAGLTAGTYAYVVRALEANGIESANSNEAGAALAPAGVPTNLAAVAGDAQVALSWTASSDAAEYKVYRGEGDAATVVATLAGSQTGYTNTGLTNDTPYTYAVAAVDAAGNESARSAAVQATPTVPATRTMEVVATTDVIDTMVKASAPTRNYGGTTVLQADSKETSTTGSFIHSYLQFDVKLQPGETVQSAKLSLHTEPTYGDTPNGPQVFRTATGWSESGMTWNTGRPARSSSTPVGDFGAVGKNARVEAAVTGVTGGLNSFELAPQDQNALQFYSSERSTSSGDFRPRLVLVVASSGGGTTAPTPAPGDTTAPTATVSPAGGATGVAVGSDITATFSEAVTGVSGTTFRLVDTATGAAVSAPAPTQVTGTNQWVLDPGADLAADTTYRVELGSGITDTAGNALTATSATFTTAAATTTPPPATGGTRTFEVVATTDVLDTMVKAAQPSTNYGGSSVLLVDSKETATTGSFVHAYLQFDVQLQPGETVQSAQLSLHTEATYGDTPNGPQVFRTATGWSESGMNWTTGRPARSSSTPVGDFGAMGKGVRIPTAVSGVTAGLNSFELAPQDQNALQFYSSERSTRSGDFRPKLIVTVTTS